MILCNVEQAFCRGLFLFFLGENEMTVSANYEEKTYVGDGETVRFPVNFKFFDDEIEVYKDKSFYRYVKGGDYTIENKATEYGGAVVFKTAPERGSFVTIIRSVPLNQLVSFIEGEDFPASDYEYSLDRIVMALQEMKEKLTRCAAAPLGEKWEVFAQKLVKLTDEWVWRENVCYQRGALACFGAENADGELALLKWYLCLEDNNIGNSPAQNPNKWLPFGYGVTAIDVLLAGKIDVSFADEVYTKEEVDNGFGNFYTKEEVDVKIGDIDTVLDVINGEEI